MTQEFDSAALELVDNAYGLSGIDAEQQTFLEDGHVQQLLPIEAIARRSRAPFARGIFKIIMQNVHAVASSLESFVDPYNPVNVHNGYPDRVDPRKFDIWMLNATCRTNVGGNITQALLAINSIPALQAISDTAAGGPVAPVSFRDVFAGWNDFTTFTDSTGIEYGLNSISGLMNVPIRRRWSAGESILMRSEVTAAASVTCAVNCFIGPVALGQDLF